jgi:4-hydroxy-tetrahydrodipicolinate reductase
MGTRLRDLIARDDGLRLAAALIREGHPAINTSAALGGPGTTDPVLFTAALSDAARVDVMIDFSLPEAVPAIVRCCRKRKIPLVVGTTGLGQSERALVEEAAAEIPILAAPNTSRAVNLLFRLVGDASRALGSAADIAIVERHHRTKKDAPSGTALRLAEFAKHGGDPLSAISASPREVDIHAIRSADCAGEHTVIFGLLGETLELNHRASNRDGFVRGALDAARFLVGKRAGLYKMSDVLECPNDAQ